jgi:transcriptional regulator with XRE-family HTH domain
MTATQARTSKGLSLREVAKILRPSRPYNPRYLRQLERHGNAPFHLAERLATLYGCPMECFLRGQDVPLNSPVADGTRPQPAPVPASRAAIQSQGLR